MKNRSSFSVCMRMLQLVKPLTGFMLLAVLMGLLGHLCAALVPILGGAAFLKILGEAVPLSLRTVFISACICAVLRGLLHYGEQGCNHYIAFKLLALIRDKIFSALRRLCPAKLENRDRGNFISVITSDIELLEVFYAHTISPIAIAFLFSLISCIFLGSFHWLYALIGLISYLTVGVLMPLLISKKSAGLGDGFRRDSGELSSYVLDSMRGLDEIMQYDRGEERLLKMEQHTDALASLEEKMKAKAGSGSACTGIILWLFDLIMLLTAGILYQQRAVSFLGLVLPVITLMSSFGPVIALSNLGSGLQNTLAAGRRVLDILDEKPETTDITNCAPCIYTGAEAKNVSFSYGDEEILSDLSAQFPENTIVGITGKSGSGKSTLLKLLMRFWQTDKGEIRISKRNISQINTFDLRDIQSYVTQETHLFHDSILNNLRIANQSATREQVVDACKKAAVHDFICTLPQGYSTPVGELGDTLSGGERQRLGLARAFLHDAPMLLLDEPTSNLDSLNEAIILQSIEKVREDKTIVLVSHRASTMSLADKVYSVEHGRIS